MNVGLSLFKKGKFGAKVDPKKLFVVISREVKRCHAEGRRQAPQLCEKPRPRLPLKA